MYGGKKTTKTRFTLIASPFRKLGKARTRTLERTAEKLAKFYDLPDAEMRFEEI